VRLTFPLLSETQMESIRSHHAGAKGSFQAFTLPDQIWSGSDTPAWFTPSGYQWIYAGKPEIEEINADGATNACLYNVSIELEAVPISRTMLLGATFKVAVDWIPGSITGFLSGATWDVTVSWLPGSLTSWQPGTIGDPYYANVSLLLNGDAFTDRSANAITVTPNGNAAIVAGQGPFGGGAMSFDGVGDGLTIPSSSGFSFTGDFTVEFWLNFASIPSGVVVGILVGLTGDSQMFVTPRSDGTGLRWGLTGVLEYSSAAFAWTTNTWFHVAVVRSSYNVKFYVNGSNISGTGTTNSISFSGDFSIANSVPGAVAFNGLIGPLRITKDIARTITVPTEPFPTFAS
jgi:hypothetical protein